MRIVLLRNASQIAQGAEFTFTNYFRYNGNSEWFDFATNSNRTHFIARAWIRMKNIEQ